MREEKELLHSELTRKIIQCCFEVMKELGAGLVIVELKCCKILPAEHQAQVINYLKASGLPVGLLVNFGNQKLEYKRLHHPNHFVVEETT